MARNGEAIHGTRPWRRFGEGPTVVKGGAMGEQSAQPFTAQDIRFTTKGGALYAIALGWPQDGVMRVGTLGQDSAFAPGSIDRVQVLGVAGSRPFQRTRKGLEVRLPEGLAGAPAVVLKLSGRGLA